MSCPLPASRRPALTVSLPSRLQSQASQRPCCSRSRLSRSSQVSIRKPRLSCPVLTLVLITVFFLSISGGKTTWSSSGRTGFATTPRSSTSRSLAQRGSDAGSLLRPTDLRPLDRPWPRFTRSPFSTTVLPSCSLLFSFSGYRFLLMTFFPWWRPNMSRRCVQLRLPFDSPSPRPTDLDRPAMTPSSSSTHSPSVFGRTYTLEEGGFENLGRPSSTSHRPASSASTSTTSATSGRGVCRRDAGGHICRLGCACDGTLMTEGPILRTLDHRLTFRF